MPAGYLKDQKILITSFSVLNKHYSGPKFANFNFEGCKNNVNIS